MEMEAVSPYSIGHFVDISLKDRIEEPLLGELE